ncbi:MAG: hypothetical protein R3F60_30125 [bacterium]
MFEGTPHPTTVRVLRALRAGARLSRNRHFVLYEDPHTRRAIALHRYLRSVVRDVEQHGDGLEVERLERPASPGRRFALQVRFPRLHGRRVAYLSAFELSLLVEDAPHVARILEACLGEPLPAAPLPATQAEPGDDPEDGSAG